MNLTTLRTKIFADGAELDSMLALYRQPYIKGFTTNPTLMRKAGVSDYRRFAHQVLAAIPDRPISFEVFSDDFEEMERQASEIATWGEHVYVKIPVTNTKQVPAYDLIHRLSHSGVKVNVTAILTLEQVRKRRGGTDRRRAVQCFGICRAHRRHRPRPRAAHDRSRRNPWRRAQSRTDLGQPARAAEHLPGGRDRLPYHHRHARHPEETVARRQEPRRVSLDTVKMFYDDARAAGFSLNVVSTT